MDKNSLHCFTSVAVRAELPANRAASLPEWSEGTHTPETFVMGMRGDCSPRQKSFNNRVRPN